MPLTFGGGHAVFPWCETVVGRRGAVSESSKLTVNRAHSVRAKFASVL